MTMKPRKLALAFTSAALLTLAGCGGGGGTTAGTTSVPVTVIDGAIRNATVCLDINVNGICDSGEPSGKTDAAGNVNLQVPTADAGKYPILAVVGTDAIDADHGPVTVPFTMTAPADKPDVVSPLTTLVQTLIATTGATSAQAEASVKAQTGINVSLFEDFTKSASADSVAAGTLARTVVLVTQQQSDTLKSTVGTTAIDGTAITQANLDKVIQNKLLEILSALVTVLADSNVQGATAANNSALLALANALVADPATGLTTTSVATLVAINNQTSSSATMVADSPAAGATLNNLTFSSAGNWFSRVFASTLAQSTPDAEGKTKNVERRNNSVSSHVASWNAGGSPNRQSDLHFNGSAWVNCALNHENSSSVRDAKGNSTYDYCDKRETGSSNRATFDIGSKTMASVITDVRAAGYTNLAIGDNTPATLNSLLGSTTFPTGAKLFYQSNTPLSQAIGYYPGTGNIVQQTSAAVAAGRTDPNASAACASILPTTPVSSYTSPASTLESMAAAAPGTPCVNGQGSVTVTTSFNPTVTKSVSSGPTPDNDNWGFSTQSIGILGTAPTGGIQTSYFTTNTLLRVAFGATSTATYYSCKQRSTDGSARNCTPIGTGSYSISYLGDARIMTLGNPPALTSGLTYQRVFVQRGGKVYLGYQNKPNVSNSARMNLTGTNAMFSQLGLPPVDPDTPLALTETSYAGNWEVFDAVVPTASTVISLSNNGTTTSCQAYENGIKVRTAFTCPLTFTNLVSGDFTKTDSDGGSTNTSTGVFNFLTGAASGTYIEVGPDATGSFTGARR